MSSVIGNQIHLRGIYMQNPTESHSSIRSDVIPSGLRNMVNYQFACLAGNTYLINTEQITNACNFTECDKLVFSR